MLANRWTYTTKCQALSDGIYFTLGWPFNYTICVVSSSYLGPRSHCLLPLTYHIWGKSLDVNIVELC